MATLFVGSFEGGSNGSAVTAVDSGFSTVSADITYTDATVVPLGGVVAAQVAPATSAARDLRINYAGAQSVLYRRFYMYLPTAPSSVFTFAQARGGGATRASLRMQGGGSLVVFNGGTNVFSAPNGTIPVGQWVRVEWRLDLPANVQQVRLFYGANLHGTTASYDTGTRTFTAGAVDQHALGIVTAQQTTVILDAVEDNDSAWVGPIGSAPATIAVSFSDAVYPDPSTLFPGAVYPGASSLTATVTPNNNTLAVGFTGTGTLTAATYGIPVPPPSVLRKFHEWTMFARGVDYAPTVALPILAAQIVVRHLGVGKAVVSTDYTAERWAALGPGMGVTLWRDGRQEFTGLVTHRQLTWSQESGRAVIQIDCEGDEVHLADRLVFPDPLRAADDQVVNDYWTYSGLASSAMRKLISDQAGPTARADRQVTGLVLGDDPGLGKSRKWSALFDSEGSALGTLQVISVTSGANLGLRMTASPGSLRADITAPRNLAGSAVFSADLSNLVGFEYSESAPSITHALAAGQGDLHARMRRQATTADPLALQWRRQRWSYIDRRDTPVAADLTDAAADALAEAEPTVSVTVTLTDSDAATYGTDWRLGDKVTVYVGLPGESKPAVVSDVIREIFLEVNDEGAETIRPAIGSYDAKAVLPTPTQRQLATVGAQLASIKRK